MVTKVPKVLWVSRHEPGAAELAELEKLLGEYVLKLYPYGFRGTEVLSRILDNQAPEIVVAVLPVKVQPHLVHELTNRGMKPFWRPVWHHRLSSGEYLDREWEFQGFEEVLDIKIHTNKLYKELPDGTD